MARLLIRQDKAPKSTLDLEPHMNVRMGRGADNEVVLDDPRSSRVHAIVSHSGQEWIVTDMDSRNGTRLNGKQVHEASLKHGDRIEIGKAVIEFEGEATDRESRPLSSRQKARNEQFEDSDFKPQAPVVEAKPRGSQGVLVLLALIVAAVGFVLVQMSQPTQEPVPPIALPADDAVGNIPNGDTSHAASAVFTYMPPAELPKALELRYKAFDIDTDDEVRVYINAQPMLALQPTGDGIWSSERSFPVTTDLLKPGEKNYVVFQHSFNKPDEAASYAWGVSDVNIAPIVELPCDVPAAEENYKIGAKLYEDRRVSARNLYDSIRRLEVALGNSKACLPKPIFYTEVTARLHEARRELEDAYKFFQVEFTKARKLGRTEDCLNYISRIQSLIPDRDDPRYLQAARWKRALPAGAEKKRDMELY